MADRPVELPAAVINRLPVRYTFDNRYFNGTYEGPAAARYTAWLQNMAADRRIEVRLDTDWFDVGTICARQSPRPVVYTGPLDRFFRLRRRPAGLAHLDFGSRCCATAGIFRAPRDELQRRRRAVHADPRVPALPSRTGLPTDKTVIMREFSRFADGDDDEPYYPINTGPTVRCWPPTGPGENRDRFGAGALRWQAGHLPVPGHARVAIASALNMYDNILAPHLRDGAPLGDGRKQPHGDIPSIRLDGVRRTMP